MPNNLIYNNMIKQSSQRFRAQLDMLDVSHVMAFTENYLLGVTLLPKLLFFQ